MKRVLHLLAVLICFSGRSQSSVYHPFPDSNAVWRYWQTQQCNPPFNPAYCGYNYQYILKGDTLISGKQYVNLFTEEWYTQCVAFQGGYSCSAPIFYSTWKGALRNDTANKKVYYITSSPESLLYDFDLQVGDTIKAQMVFGSVITRIDSILVGNNYRKCFNAQHLSEKYSIIEGIGLVDVDSSGWGLWADLFFPGPCVCSASWGFDCFWQDGVHLYGDTGCTIINSVAGIEQKTPVKFYPNPADNEINLELAGELSFKVYNNLGNVLLTGQASHSSKISVSALPPGIYLLLFSDGQRKKIIIQH